MVAICDHIWRHREHVELPVTAKQIPIPAERIEKTIFLIRGHKVMLDADLADLYGVTTKRLNEQVRRNLSRFPADFMFQLDEQEASGLRWQPRSGEPI